MEINPFETSVIGLADLIYCEIVRGGLNHGNNSRRTLLARDFMRQYDVPKTREGVRKVVACFKLMEGRQDCWEGLVKAGYKSFINWDPRKKRRNAKYLDMQRKGKI